MKEIVQFTFLALVITMSAGAQTPEKAKHLNIDSDYLALDGYDPVAYFKEKKAIKGKDSLTIHSIAGIKMSSL